MNRIFACSDLHGNYKVFQSILQKIDETDKVIILGDVVDRGEHGFQMLKEILLDKRFILIKGNHEDMFVDDMREFHRNEGRDESHAWNGGDPTFWA
jgi:serine/threonine protein phosphatase 1